MFGGRNARLRAEINASMLALQLKGRVAAAGPFTSLLLDGAAPAEGLAAPGAFGMRYLYEIESGRKMTAVQQSVLAWLIFGMFFVVIPLAGVLIQERNDGTLARLVSFGVSPWAIVGGKLVAATTRSFDHAAALGGGANVVLAALAGIMVPRPLMPAAMQIVSEWSPMGWALDGMQAVFLGAPDAALVVPKALLLLAFATACLLLSLRPLRQLDR